MYSLHASVKKRFAILALFLSVIALVFSVFNPIFSAQAEDDPYKLVLRIGTRDSVIVEGATPKTDYFSGEPIPASARFEASGTLVDLQNPTIRIVVPKIAPVTPTNPRTDDKYLVDPQFVSSGQAIAERRGEDANSWWIEYDFESIKGGTNLEYPFPINFKNLVTPDGVSVTPVVTLLDENGATLLEESITFTAKAGSSYAGSKKGTILGRGWVSDDYGGTLAQLPDTEKVSQVLLDKIFPDQASFDAARSNLLQAREGTRQSYEICAVYSPPTGTPADQGEYRSQTITITDKLPEHAKWLADPALNPGWTYDAVTHTATYSGTVTSSASTLCKRLVLDFSGAQLSENGDITCNATGTICNNAAPYEIHVNRAVVTLDKGLASEMVLPEVKWDHYYLAKHTLYTHLRTYSNTFRKSVSSDERNNTPHSYYDGEIWRRDKVVDGDSTASTLNYSIVFYNRNNGQTFKEPGVPVFGGEVAFVSQIEDRELDSRLYFTNLLFDVSAGIDPGAERTIEETRARFNAAKPKLVGVLADGSEEVIQEVVTANSVINLNDVARKYAGWKLVFTTPLEVDNYDLKGTVWVYPTEAEMQNWAEGKYNTAQQYYNGAQTTFQMGSTNYVQQQGADGSVTWVPGEKKLNPTVQKTKYDYAEVDNFITLNSINPMIRQASTANVVVPYVNCERDLGAGVALNTANCTRLRQFAVSTTSDNLQLGRWGGMNQPAENFRQIVLLPPGVEYKYTSGTAPTPKVIPNFQNTGKTAVVYEYGDVSLDTTKRVSLVLDTTIYAEEGLNNVEFYTLWDNNTDIDDINASPGTNHGLWVDALDLDGDGNTTEKFLKTTNTITFIPPAEVRIRKLISLDGRAWMFEAPAQDLGGDIYYQISITNGDRVPLGRVYVIDVLPSLNDHTIVDGVLPDGSVGYAPRWWTKIDPETGEATRVEHSGYVTPLVTALEDVAQNSGSKFEYRYSVTPQGADLASVRDAQWLTKDEFVAQYGDTPEAWAKVTSVRFSLKSGESLQAKETANIVIKSEIPYNSTTKELPAGTKAVNSAALSTTNSGYLEANNVRSEIVKYSVEGVVFSDANSDSRLTDTERKLSGYKVELINRETGEVAKDPDGNPYVTTTDENGHYWFDVYTRGSYEVRFTINDGDVFAKFEADTLNRLGSTADKKVDSHAQPAEAASLAALTDAFALNPTARHEIRNAGIVPGSAPVSLLKVDEFCAPVKDVAFELKWQNAVPGKDTPAPIPGPFTVQTDANGKLLYPRVPVGVYTLTEKAETTPEHLVALTKTVQVTVTTDEITHDAPALSAATSAACEAASINLDTNLVIENKWKRGTVEILKRDADVTNINLQGAVFQLFNSEGEAIVNPETQQPLYVSAPTTENGVTKIENVLWGTYQLKEVEAPENYLLPEGHVDVKITDNQQVLNLTLPNTVFKGTVKAKKIGNPIGEPLAGVEFTLTPKDAPGAEVATALTDENGVVTFSGVRFGTYVLTESKPLANYQPSAESNGREVEITADGQVVDLADPFLNEIKTGTVTLQKFDADHTKEALSGVKFELFAKDRKTARDAYLVQNPVEAGATDPTADPDWAWEELALYSAVSAEDGSVNFTDVVYGEYVLREVETLESHNLLTEDFAVTIDTHGQVVDLGVVENEIKRADIKLVKENPEQERLAGAIFELRQGDTVIAEGQTDAEGTLIFEDVAYGDYTVVETKAPEGYLLAEVEIPVSVTEEGAVVDLGVIENSPIPVEPEEPTDPSVPNPDLPKPPTPSLAITGAAIAGLAGASLGLFGLAAALMLYRRRKENA